MASFVVVGFFGKAVTSQYYNICYYIYGEVFCQEETGQRDKKDKTLCTVKAESFVLLSCLRNWKIYLQRFVSLTMV